MERRSFVDCESERRVCRVVEEGYGRVCWVVKRSGRISSTSSGERVKPNCIFSGERSVEASELRSRVWCERWDESEVCAVVSLPCPH